MPGVKLWWLQHECTGDTTVTHQAISEHFDTFYVECCSVKDRVKRIWHKEYDTTLCIIRQTGSETVVAPAWLYWRHHSHTPGHQWAFWYILSSMPLGQRLSQRNKTQHNTAKAWRRNCDDFSTGSSLCALEKPQPRNQIISGVLRPYK